MWASAFTVLSTLSFISSSQTNRHFVCGPHLASTVFSTLRFMSSFQTNIYFSGGASFVIYLKRKFYFLHVGFSSTVLSILSFVSSSQMNKTDIMCFKNFVYLEDFYSFCTDIISPGIVCWFIHLNLRAISWFFHHTVKMWRVISTWITTVMVSFIMKMTKSFSQAGHLQNT